MKSMIAVAFSGMFLYGVATLGRYPVGEEPTQGVIRLTWRSPGAKVRVCKRVTEEERKNVPIHMRRDAGCNVHILPYRLIATVGPNHVDRLIVPPGIHGDRPLVVQEEFQLAPGIYPVQVTFTPELPGLDENDPAVQDGLSKAVRFEMSRNLVVEKGRATLVTLGVDGRTPVIP